MVNVNHQLNDTGQSWEEMSVIRIEQAPAHAGPDEAPKKTILVQGPLGVSANIGHVLSAEWPCHKQHCGVSQSSCPGHSYPTTQFPQPQQQLLETKGTQKNQGAKVAEVRD
jgi:hypothetical protein